MEIIGIILAGFGIILALIGGIWFLVAAFQESVLWGLGCIFIPFVALFFLIMHWDRAAKPFLVQLAGIVLMVVGGMLMGPTLDMEHLPQAKRALSVLCASYCQRVHATA